MRILNKDNMSSLFKKLQYAGETVKDVTISTINGEDLFCSNIEEQKRLETCNKCEYFVKETNRCNECGCFMKIKSNLKAAKCPLNKWNNN